MRAGAFMVGANLATLVLNLITGILVARTLGPDGRGALTAVFASVPILAWIFAMGCRTAVIRHQVRHPADAPRLIATWLTLLLPLAATAIVAGQALLPHLLSAQSSDTLALARVLMFTVALLFLSDLFYGVALGDHDFRFYNLMLFMRPSAVAIAYVALWRLDVFSVTAAAAVMTAALAVDTIVVGARVIRRHGVGRPSRALGERTLWFGFRAHGTSTAGIVTTRLDVMIIPAFVSAGEVGLYGIATSVSWIAYTVAGSLATLVYPAAAARDRDAARTVVHGLYATLAVGVVVGGAIAVGADIGVRTIYGPEFAGSVEPLRILLLGSVLYAGAAVLFSGLTAADRPLTAGFAQGAGAIATVVGLLLFLKQGGIEAAAVVSTFSYGLVFAISFVLYRGVMGLAWRDSVPTRALLETWLSAARVSVWRGSRGARAR